MAFEVAVAAVLMALPPSSWVETRLWVALRASARFTRENFAC